ncbi:PrsW family intramembrane metalloprotease [Pilimelia columellifera]|uniref:PrsW family intramembrane metalloprotease n=1 Tax=Pilimelia columellifera subsp. columellifera TaxID=706583 RepID=A0ABN3NEY9_9ACTN
MVEQTPGPGSPHPPAVHPPAGAPAGASLGGPLGGGQWPYGPYGESSRQRGRGRILLLVAVIGGIAACALGILGFLGFSIGPVALTIGIAAAVLPVPVLVACFLWLDRYEPEPVKYLLFCFCWGAFVSTLASLGVNSGASWLFDRVGLPDSLVAVLVAPFIEELTKALGPLLLLWRRRREISGITDGIVYCGLAATGFAMVENILYLGGHGYAANADEFGPASGAQAVVAMFIARILLTGFAHPLFTALTGVGIGLAARSPRRWVRWVAPAVGMVGAMILHGAWNLMATLTAEAGEPLVFLYGYFTVMVPIFFGMVGLAIWLRAWEGRLTERMLPRYATAGWLSPPEVAAMGSLGRRHAARAWARRVAGEPGRRAMRTFQFTAMRLALLRDGIERGLDTDHQQVMRSAAEEWRLLQQLSASRGVFTGRDPVTPPALWDGRQYLIVFPDGVRRAVAAPAAPVVPLPMAPPTPAYAGFAPFPGAPGGYPAPTGRYPNPPAGHPNPPGGWR